MGLDRTTYEFFRQKTIDWLKITGRTQVIGSETINVIMYNTDGMPAICYGLTVPTDHTAGYAKGCIFIKTDAADHSAALYSNLGTAVVCDFDLIGTSAVADESITYAKMQHVSATDKILGRSTAGAGDVEEIACTAAGRALIDDAAASNQRTTLGLGSLALLSGVVPSVTSGVACVLSGVPSLSDVNWLVVSTEMKVGTYTLAHTNSGDSFARNVTVTTVAAGAADTPGTILVTGTNNSDAVITETIIPVQGTTVAGLKAFKTITSVVGAGWVISAGNDTIEVGFGDLLGFPMILTAEANVVLVLFDMDILEDGYTVTIGAAVSDCTISAENVASFNAAKKFLVLYIAA